MKLNYPAIGETIDRVETDAGVRVAVIKKPGYARKVAMVAVDYGGADRRFLSKDEWVDTPSGVAHFLEHKMFDMPNDENIQGKFSALGARSNAFTSSGMTAYYFECTENFRENLELLLRMVATPWFTKEGVDKERGIIAQEINMVEESPDNVGFDEALRCLFDENPIRDPIVGTQDSIKKINSKILNRCYKAFYVPANITVCVVGDVEATDVTSAVIRNFGERLTKRPEVDYGRDEGLMPVRKRFEKEMDVAAPIVNIVCKISYPEKGIAMLKQKMVASLALSYLFSQSSPFYMRLYAEGLLNTDFACGMDYSAGVAAFMAEGETTEPERVFAEMCDEIKRVQTAGMDDRLWSRVRKSSYGGRIRALSSFYGLCCSMAEGELGGYNCLDAFELEKSITKEDVLDFIRNEFDTERFAMSVIKPLSNTEEDEEK